MAPELGQVEWRMVTTILSVNLCPVVDKHLEALNVAFTGRLMHWCDTVIILTEHKHIHVQSNLDISNSDISNSAKLEASI